MSKRIICFVDYHSAGGVYSYLCVNFPATLLDDFNNIDLKDLSAFELFYFAHKDEIEMKSFFVDKTFISFVMFFSSLFECKNPSSLSILNDVLDSIYNSCSPEQINSILQEKKAESIAVYIEEIKKELSYRDDDVSYLLAQSNNLLKSIVGSQELESSRDYSEDVLLQSVYYEVNDIFNEWIDDTQEYEFLGTFNNFYKSYYKNNSPIVDRWITDVAEVNVLESILESMTKILENSIYKYDQFSDEMRSDLFDLWILLVTTGYKVVFASKFYKNLTRIIPR
jgi:hypothetical protein